MTIWVIVVAAGSGTRFGGRKQFEVLGGRRLLEWSLAAAGSVAAGVVVVTAPSTRAAVAGSLESCWPAVTVVDGGPTRSASVRAGLSAVPADAEIIAVHDAARPLATAALFERVVQAVRDGADGAVPGVPVVDTIRHRDGGAVDRDLLVAVQTPQAFRAEVLRAAHRSGAEATDDASLVEMDGGRVVIVPGEQENRKVTTRADLAIAQVMLDRRPSSEDA